MATARTPTTRAAGAVSARALVFVSALLVWTSGFSASANERPRRIFLLEGQAATQPAGVATFGAFKQRLNESSFANYDIYLDYLELGRFPGRAHEERTVRFLAEKFRQNPPDLLVPNGSGSLSLMVRHRDAIAPGVPIIYCCMPAAAADALDLPRGVVGVISEFNWGETLELAARLQPGVRNVVLVSGASELDKVWRQRALDSLAPYLQPYQLRHLDDLTHSDLLKEVARLPRDTIVLLGSFFADAAGRRFFAPDVAADVAAASSAPVYAPASSFLGRGIVGGYMDSFEAQGVAAADLALAIFAGKDPATLPPQTKPPHEHKVDANALKRWGMSESALPSGTRVVFKAPSLWEQHYRLVIGGLAAFGLQTAVLAVLLVQTRKRRQAERSLQESEERIAYTATSTNTGLWHLDVSSNRGWATERCRSMLGLAPDAPFSREAILCIAHPEDRRQVEDALERATRSGAPSEAELRIVAPGREERWVIMRVHPHVNSHDLPRRIAGIFADVTARKKAEAEVEARRAELAHLMRVSLLGELSGAIAHEINQPLASILLNAQTARLVLAAQSPDLDLVRAVIDDIEADDIRATEVIHRLRRLLRKNESQSEPVDLNGLMESTLRMLRGELVNRKIEVDIALSGDLPAAVGDPVQLQQVLLNLLMNAMDAMGETAPARRLIMVRTRSDSNGTVEAVVADRGRGIAPDEQRRLFEPFFTTKGHGLGLGLSICSSIASAHGGSLTIDNNTDGGATAVFRLPTRPGIAGPP